MTFAILYFAQEQTTLRKGSICETCRLSDDLLRSHAGPFYRLKNGEKSEVVKLKQRRANAAVKNLPRRRVAKMLAKILDYWAPNTDQSVSARALWAIRQVYESARSLARPRYGSVWLGLPPSLLRLRLPPSSSIQSVRVRPCHGRARAENHQARRAARRRFTAVPHPRILESVLHQLRVKKKKKSEKKELYSLPPLENSHFVSALRHESQ